jgi:exopolysaccharide biosynthesis polyprenyl glycosylphosphotransferase
MLKEKARLVAGIVYVFDLAFVSAAFLAAHFVRGQLAPALGLGQPGLPPIERYLPLLPLVLVIWSVLLWSSGRYRSHRQVPLLAEAGAIVRVCLVGAATFALVIWSLRIDERLFASDHISRSFLALFALFSTAALLSEKLALRLTARLLRERGLNYRTIVVVGTGASAVGIVQSIQAHRWWGYRVLGFVDGGEEDGARDPLAQPILGTLADLDALRARVIVDEVIFALPARSLARFENCVIALQEQGTLVRFALDLFPHARARVLTQEIDGVPLVSMAMSPSGPLEMALKRGVDVALSLALLALAWPVLLVVALGIRLTGRGGVFFQQRRCGLNGRQFTLYKFRTMVEGAHERMTEVAHLNEVDGPVFKVRRDPRVTRFGRFLRRFSLDELPQLWNVLRGDMSLVGPRPFVIHEADQIVGWAGRRLDITPGITGPWQVMGRNDLTFDEMTTLDYVYVTNWSLWWDIKILIKTIPAVLARKGAY